MHVVPASQVSPGPTPSSATGVMALKAFRDECLREVRTKPSSVSEDVLADDVWCGDVGTQLHEQADAFEPERAAFEDVRRFAI